MTRSPLLLAKGMLVYFYLAPLGIWALVGRVIAVHEVAVSSMAGRVLGPALVAVGAADYILSLVLERSMLRRAALRPDPAQGVFTAALAVGILGASLGMYGVLLSVLGLSGPAFILYAMCIFHGVHLALRWRDYEAAAAEGVSGQ